MMRHIEITGRLTSNDLKQAINTAFNFAYGDYINTTDVGVTHWGQDNDGTLYLSFRHGEKCTNPFPISMNNEMIYLMVEKYLSGMEKDNTVSKGGDGSTMKGFSLTFNEFNVEYDFKIKFETLYYGK